MQTFMSFKLNIYYVLRNVFSVISGRNSRVAPSTIGIISYVYCGYKRINETFNCV